MNRLIKILKNYKITEVTQVHELFFWITLVISFVALFYIIWKY